MKLQIIPTILAPDRGEAVKKIRLVESAAPWIQIDAADGIFVPNKTWYDASEYRHEDLKPTVELHLMVRNPASVIDAWRGIPQFKRVIWHVECPIDHQPLIMACRERGLEVGLALSAHTPIERVLPYASKLDTVLIMGIEPGFSGQELIPDTIDKAAAMHRALPHMPLGLDGGVRSSHFAALADAGVVYFYMGSAIFRDEDPSSFYQAQQALLETLGGPS